MEELKSRASRATGCCGCDGYLRWLQHLGLDKYIADVQVANQHCIIVWLTDGCQWCRCRDESINASFKLANRHRGKCWNYSPRKPKLTRNLKALGKLGTLATEIAWINLAFKLGDDKMMQRHPSQWSTESTENVGITYHGKGIQRLVGNTREEGRIIQSHCSRGYWHDWAHHIYGNYTGRRNSTLAEIQIWWTLQASVLTLGHPLVTSCMTVVVSEIQVN